MPTSRPPPQGTGGGRGRVAPGPTIGGETGVLARWSDADSVGDPDRGAHMALDIGRRRLEQEVRAARREGRAVPTVVIVGAGFSGLGFAIQLIRSGIREFTIIEQSDGVGGTWKENTYPGSGCDVPSHLYSFSFAPKSDWTRRYAEQPEILTYADRLVRRYRLGPHLRLGTTVTGAELDEASGQWRVTVSPTPAVTGDTPGRTEEITADAVIFACGQLNRPHIPDLAGLEEFRRTDLALGPLGP